MQLGVLRTSRHPRSAAAGLLAENKIAAHKREHRLRAAGAWASVAGLIAAGILLVGHAPEAATGIRNGLTVCGELLIPSVYPMMILCALFLRCGAAERLGRLLAPVTQLLFGLPGQAGTVFLTAMLGGYPVGARGIHELRTRGAITDVQARQMVCFCVGAGPGFVIGTVGCGLFGSRTLGGILLAGQIGAAVLLGMLSRIFFRCERSTGRCKADSADAFPAPAKTTLTASAKSGAPTGRTSAASEKDIPERSVGFSDALTGAVTDASASMLTLCAFVLAFAGGMPLLELLPVFRNQAVASILRLLPEVTGAVQAARAAGSPVRAAFALGFGGLCVHGQICTLSGVHCRLFFPARLLHGLLSAVLTAGALRLLSVPDPVLLPVSVAPAAAVCSVNGAFSAALLGLVTVFLLSLPGENYFRRPKKA